MCNYVKIYFLLRILLGCVCVNCELKKNIGVSNALKIVLDISSLSISLLTNFAIYFCFIARCNTYLLHVYLVKGFGLFL